MGKGSARRPEDPRKIAENWPFPDPQRMSGHGPFDAVAFTPAAVMWDGGHDPDCRGACWPEGEPEPLLGWCVQCHAGLFGITDCAACSNPICVAYMQPTSQVSYLPRRQAAG